MRYFDTLMLMNFSDRLNLFLVLLLVESFPSEGRDKTLQIKLIHLKDSELIASC